MRRKFLMISTMWDNAYLYDIITGIKNRFGDENYVIHIFNAYDISDWEGSLKKEQEIYTLFDPDEYEGVFVASNSIGNLHVINRSLDEMRVRNIPIVSMGVEIGNATYVGIENHRALYRVVEHMILEHNCKSFNFVGGPIDNEEAKKRWHGYRDALDKYGIKCDENREIMLGYLYEDGIRAYEAFKERGCHLADAVICANDSMALGYCDRAGEDGYYAPNDFRITGFDDYHLAREYVPSITTVNMNWENMGYVGADKMLEILSGIDVENESYSNEIIKCNQSCGCISVRRDYRPDSLIKIKRKKLDEQVAIGHRYILQVMCSCGDINQMQQKLHEIMKVVQLEHICVCINESILESDFSSSKNGYDRHFILCTEDEMERIDRNYQLIPTSWLDNEDMTVLMFSPLYFAKNTFGYTVIPYGKTLVYYTKQRNLFENMSVALESIRQRAELKFMNHKLNELYMHDSLTGLYNRFGYGKLAEKFFDENNGEIYAVYFDVNKLKTINDVYGHEMGDVSISGVADAIKSVFIGDEICIRMGGDEFLVLGKCSDNFGEDEIRLKTNSFLQNLANNMQLPFEISASIGYASNMETGNSNLEGLLCVADKRMYKDKSGYKELKVRV